MSKTVRIKVYKFDELSEKAKEKAISDQIDYEVQFVGQDGESNPYWSLYEEMERMQTPWFLGQEIYKRYKDDIIQTLKDAERDYLENGTIYS